MSNSSDHSTGYFGGLIAGLVALSIFGVASMVVFLMVDTKEPTDRTYEGDFTAKRVAQRSQTLEIVTAEQEGSLDSEKLQAALANFKPEAEGKTAIPFPGSATALKAAQAPPAAEKPAAESEEAPEPAPAPVAPAVAVPDANAPEPAAPGGKGKGKAKQNPAPKGIGKAQKGVAPKGKGDAPKGKGATPKGKGDSPKGKSDAPKGKGKGKGKAADEAEGTSGDTPAQ